ncbi:MAG: DNA alkylation repair protein [Armatimonadetes bacterium]|nr:DNA alkylation repair protein [Armatimonadota bacterium]
MTRKGARRMAEIPPEILAQLNQGTLPTVNLVEGLAMDLGALHRSVFGEPGLVVEGGYLGRMKTVGESLTVDQFHLAKNHVSDTVRGWACYSLAARSLAFPELLESFRAFAADPHFGVREWAWLAARPAVTENLAEALEILRDWTASDDEGIRRFASEVTRPRGVWCAHLEPLKAEPARGLHLIEPLRSDPSKYVRDSVANWLNDASKAHPDWVREVTARWSKESPTKETAYVVRRATRSLKEAR